MKSDSDAKKSDHATAGALSGFITRLICQPFDVVKIRFQIEPIKKTHESKYRSIVHAVDLIVKEEGISALWKGHIPAQLLSVIYGTAQFYSFNVLKKYSDSILSIPEWDKSINFVAGAAAGGIATIVSFPFDTVRTRLVAQSSKNQIYQGFTHPYTAIFKTEGSTAFFRGLLPTLLQILPHAGLQFMFYNIFVDAYKRYNNETETKFANSLIAGGGAGLLAKTAIYPFDLARKRLQIQGFEHGRKGFGKFFSCRGLIDCLVKTIKAEGLQGLFKGLVPSQLKATVTSALHFTAFEQSLILLRKIRKFQKSNV